MHSRSSMPGTNLYIRSLNGAAGKRWTGTIEPRTDDGRAALLPDDIANSYSAYKHIVGEGLQRIVRSGRIIGPLALAATASGGCDGRYVASGVIIAILAGLVTYFGIKGHRPKTTELPSYFQMFSRGIADGVWHRYLQKLVKDSPSRSVRARKGKLYTNEGAELSLMQHVVRRSVLRFPVEEDRRAVFAAASRNYNAPTDVSDLPRTFEYLDDVALSLHPMYSMVEAQPLSETIPDSLSPEYIKLVEGMQRYDNYIGELADVYEPALLAHYLAKRGHWAEARTMVKLISLKESDLATEDIASLFVEIPDMQSAVYGASSGSRMKPMHGISEESRRVGAHIHAYFARTLKDNVDDSYARGIALWHIEATGKLAGNNYITRAMSELRRKDPSVPPAVLPSLAQPTGNWKINLAQITLMQLHLRA